MKWDKGKLQEEVSKQQKLNEWMSKPKLSLTQYLKYRLEWLEELSVKIIWKISNLLSFVTCNSGFLQSSN